MTLWQRSYVLKRIDFSNDADQLCQFVGAVKETGGGDEPECYELVLRDAQSLGWTFANSSADGGEKQAEAEEEKANTAETMKALVIIGDEVPHETGTEYKWREELAALKAKGIYVYGVQCANNDHADEFYRTLAEVSGGHHLRLTDIKEMERLIKGLCYRQATDFMAASEESSGVASGVDATTSGQQGEPLSLHPALEAIHNAIHTPDQVPSARSMLVTQRMHIHFFPIEINRKRSRSMASNMSSPRRRTPVADSCKSTG